MGAVTGNQLKAKTRRVQGVNNAAGEEITDPAEWCDAFSEHYFDEAKQAYDGATAEDRAAIDKILGGTSDPMQSKANLQSYISDLQDVEDKVDIMNGIKSAFPGAF